MGGCVGSIRKDRGDIYLSTFQISVEIKLINGEVKLNKFQYDITGQRLKQHIARFMCPELSVQDMSLYYGDIKIQNHVHLSELNRPQSQTIKIMQKKLEVKDYPETYLKIHANEEDSETYQSGVVEMICGCRRGQEAMITILRTILRQSKSIIRCPKHPNVEWQLRICKKVARLTTSQRKQIQYGLSMNDIRNNTHNNTICSCPNKQCRQLIMIENPALIRIKCPKCCKDFCSKCKDQWKNNKDRLFCGNDSCCLIQQGVNKILADCLEKDMPLFVAKVRQNFKVPSLRACIFCKMIIQHDEGCKHMTCNDCKNQFCFVCLKKYQNGKWPCGAYNEYCNYIHPRQKF